MHLPLGASNKLFILYAEGGMDKKATFHLSPPPPKKGILIMLSKIPILYPEFSSIIQSAAHTQTLISHAEGVLKTTFYYDASYQLIAIREEHPYLSGSLPKYWKIT